MSGRARVLLLLALLGAGAALVTALILRQATTPLPASFAPLFELAGTPVKAVDHLVTRVVPVSDVDERELGEIFHARFAAQADTADARDIVYLNALMRGLAREARRPFAYRVHVLPYDEPNAAALPGGVILVTRGLLRTLGSEAELVAVLGHELAHVELGHCLDAVRFRLLADKVGARTLGAIADVALRLLVSHSFSKTQEDAADEYAFAALTRGPYDPRGAGLAFASLLSWTRRHPEAAPPHGIDPLRDYFRSHPPLELREAKFRAQAEAWWRRHPGEVRRLGVENLRDRVTVARG